MKRRLVVYIGLDSKSMSLIRRIKNSRSLFDEVTIIQIPEYRESVLEKLSIPSMVIEEIA